jgi:anti-anti-sigma factor
MTQLAIAASDPVNPAVVRVHGELDFASAPGLRDHLDLLAGDVELDCSRLTFLDCAGLGALIAAHQAWEARGDRLVVGRLHGLPLRVAQLTGMDALLHLETSFAVVS